MSMDEFKVWTESCSSKLDYMDLPQKVDVGIVCRPPHVSNSDIFIHNLAKNYLAFHPSGEVIIVRDAPLQHTEPNVRSFHCNPFDPSSFWTIRIDENVLMIIDDYHGMNEQMFEIFSSFFGMCQCMAIVYRNDIPFVERATTIGVTDMSASAEEMRAVERMYGGGL